MPCLMRQLAREPSLLATQLLVHLGMAAFLGAAFLDVSDDVAGTVENTAWLPRTTSYPQLGCRLASPGLTVA